MKKKVIVFVVLVVFLCLGAFIYYKITTSLNYKLKKLGYNESEINIMKDKLKKTDQEKLLNYSYDKEIISFIKEQYFIFGNLDKYLSFSKEHKDYEINKVITIINVGADKDHYSSVKDTDVSKGNLILVNKFTKLNENFEINDLVKISNNYSYGDNYIKEEVYNHFISMWNAAKKENLTLIVNSAYRSYKDQEETYNDIKTVRGNDADKVAARPGHSEHQTGLALDVITYNTKGADFDKTEEFKWLQNNAHKYGFILRYHHGKEYLTGYNYESWHYRFVGVEAATAINEKNITFEEYYTYYVEGNFR